MKRYLFPSVVAPALLLISACSSEEPTPMDAGQRMSQRGDEIGEYGAAWSAGQQEVERGKRTVEKSNSNLVAAEERLARARADVTKAEERIRTVQSQRADAEQLIAAGTVKMQRAEADYAAVRAGPAATAADPK